MDAEEGQRAGERAMGKSGGESRPGAKIGLEGLSSVVSASNRSENEKVEAL